MQLNGARILLTGATGGLGEALARQLAEKGAALLLTGREPEGLARIELPAATEYVLLQADLAAAGAVDQVLAAAHQFRINMLINCAGIGGFGLLEEQGANEVERILRINLEAPVRLTQAVLPLLLEQPEAAIVNVGSAFGSIPFAGFTVYSAAKAGLKGFSQALRRELADTRVAVFHVAPRAIDTPLNSPAVNALNRALGNACDQPAAVAERIVRQLEGKPGDAVFGFPERLFAWINGFAPGLVDNGVRGKLSVIRRHATKRI